MKGQDDSAVREAELVSRAMEVIRGELDSSSDPLSYTQLAEACQAAGVEEPYINRAVWRLIDVDGLDQYAGLDRDLKLIKLS